MSEAIASYPECDGFDAAQHWPVAANLSQNVTMHLSLTRRASYRSMGMELVKSGPWPSIVTTIGYTCPMCGRKVPVIGSSILPTLDSDFYFSECDCGYHRAVPRSEAQELEVWREVNFI
jgi:hypothetical protein